MSPRQITSTYATKPNLQAKERQLTRFTHDALHNLHEIAYG